MFLGEGLFTLFLQVRTWLKQRQSRRATTPRLAAWARSVTTSGAVLTPFPTGCGQKGHAPRCEALPDIESGRVSRLAHDLFDSQRILPKWWGQALQRLDGRQPAHQLLHEVGLHIAIQEIFFGFLGEHRRFVEADVALLE